MGCKTNKVQVFFAYEFNYKLRENIDEFYEITSKNHFQGLFSFHFERNHEGVESKKKTIMHVKRVHAHRHKIRVNKISNETNLREKCSDVIV